MFVLVIEINKNKYNLGIGTEGKIESLLDNIMNTYHMFVDDEKEAFANKNGNDYQKFVDKFNKDFIGFVAKVNHTLSIAYPLDNFHYKPYDFFYAMFQDEISFEIIDMSKSDFILN